MKLTKRMLSLLLAFLLMTGTIPSSVYASAPPGDGADTSVTEILGSPGDLDEEAPPDETDEAPFFEQTEDAAPDSSVAEKEEDLPELDVDDDTPAAPTENDSVESDEQANTEANAEENTAKDVPAEKKEPLPSDKQGLPSLLQSLMSGMSFGISTQAIADEDDATWTAFNYVDKHITFQTASSGFTVSSKLAQNSHVSPAGKNYAGSKYYVFTNTSFESDVYVLYPKAGYYLLNGNYYNVDVKLQLRLLTDNEKHATPPGAFCDGHFGNANYFTNGRDERGYCYIGIRPLFYYAGTNNEITDYYYTGYCVDIDPQTTQGGKTPGVEAWAVVGGPDNGGRVDENGEPAPNLGVLGVDRSTPSKLRTTSNLSQNAGGYQGGSSLKSPFALWGKGSNWFYSSETTTTDEKVNAGDSQNAIRVRYRSTYTYTDSKTGKKVTNMQRLQLWYSADVAHFESFTGVTNNVQYNVINSASEIQMLEAANNNKSVVPGTFKVLTFANTTSASVANKYINKHTNLTRADWQFSGWYTSRSAVPATWEQAKSQYNASGDYVSWYAGIEKTTSNVQLYGKYYYVEPELPDPFNAKVRVVKTCGDTSEKLEGAEFTLYEWDTAQNAYAVYDVLSELDGEYFIDNLRHTSSNEGKFKVVETTAPVGVANIGWEQEFTVQGTENEEFSFTCVDPIPKGDLKIVKTDASTGNAMSSVRFSLEALEDITTGWGTLLVAEGTVITDTILTDENGEAWVSDLYSGRYALTEVVPNGYFHIEPIEVEIVLPLDESETKTLVELPVENTPMLPRLAVAKLADKTTGAVLDPDTGRYDGTKAPGTYQPEEQITFTLTGTNVGNVDLYDVTLVEDTSNYAEYLLPDSFTYGLAVGDTITTTNGNTATVTAVSTSGNLYTVKLDELEAGDSFALTASCACVSTTGNVENLLNVVTIGGKYDASDNDNKDDLIEVPSTPEMEDEDHFNLNGEGSISLIKYDNNGKTPLKGVTFALMNKKGEIVEERTTDGNGKAVFQHLPLGDYTIIETKTTPGHALLPSPIKVSIPAKLTEAEALAQGYTLANGTLKDGNYWFVDVSLKVYNSSVLRMPATGGNTAALWSFFGFAGACFFLLAFKRRRPDC